MTWTKQKLEQTLSYLRKRGYDSTEIEVKSAHQGMPQNLGETISAFANMPDGGVPAQYKDDAWVRNFCKGATPRHDGVDQPDLVGLDKALREGN